MIIDLMLGSLCKRVQLEEEKVRSFFSRFSKIENLAKNNRTFKSELVTIIQQRDVSFCGNPCTDVAHNQTAD